MRNAEDPNNKLLSLTTYNDQHCTVIEGDSIEEIIPYLSPERVNWINVNRLDHKTIEQIGNQFDLHYLIIEDVLNVRHMPKIEIHDEFIFVTLKALYFDRTNIQLEQEHISFIILKNMILTFQENNQDEFDTVRNRITKDEKSKLRKKGADYLFYLLLDMIVDNYTLLIEDLREQIDAIEDRILESPNRNYIKMIHRIKKELNAFHKSIYPLKELVNIIKFEESELLDTTNNIYFSDIYDHITSLTNTFESLREMLSSLIDLNMSNMSNSMNGVMKTLTIMSSIFIPMTFIAGVYGMNFDIMPELNWKYGYLFAWSIMMVFAIGMLIFMKRKRWF